MAVAPAGSAQYSAIVLGATGNVGGRIVQLLIKNPLCKKVVVVTRRKTDAFADPTKWPLINYLAGGTSGGAVTLSRWVFAAGPSLCGAGSRLSGACFPQLQRQLGRGTWALIDR